MKILGHIFKKTIQFKDPAADSYYICENCKILVYKSCGTHTDPSGYYVSVANKNNMNLFRSKLLDISCDEMIIKSIIE